MKRLFLIFSFLLSIATHAQTNFNLVARPGVFAGYIFWQLISTVITDVSNSLSANSNILTKVYFPRLIIPGSSVITSMVDFFISFVIFNFIDNISLLKHYLNCFLPES